MSTFQKISFKAMGKSSVASFVKAVKEAGSITINKVIDLGEKKEKANITHIMGSNFLDVTLAEKNYPRIGFDLFCKAILTAEIESKIDVSPDAIDSVNLAFEAKLGSAYARQETKLAKLKAKAKI